jgi:DNA (cytosine-5)-methyltransferase 1
MPILEAGARTGKSTTDLRAGIGIGNEGDPMFTLQAGKQHAVAFDWQSGGDARGLDPKDTAQLQACQTPATFGGSGIRRLTPRECERLQGFPDDYTLAPYRGKAMSDGPRYKMLGNSMAVPVMRWLGERITLMEEILSACR